MTENENRNRLTDQPAEGSRSFLHCPTETPSGHSEPLYQKLYPGHRLFLRAVPLWDEGLPATNPDGSVFSPTPEAMAQLRDEAAGRPVETVFPSVRRKLMLSQMAPWVRRRYEVSE